VFTLFAIAFFFMGVILFGIGLVGEYVGRIYQQVRARPRYVVATILQGTPAQADVDGIEKRQVVR
jgi:undecaprenyl-phosphate 4-deoxy-4-formamido-L-arabinose transferase